MKLQIQKATKKFKKKKKKKNANIDKTKLRDTKNISSRRNKKLLRL